MTRYTVHIDFETRSTADLKRCGVDKYAEHSSTKVLCLGYKIDKQPVRLWIPGQPFPQELIQAIADGARFVAHNMAFDRTVWNVVLRRMTPDVPELPIGLTDCTMIRALALGLPGGLADVCKALDLPVQKDMDGYAVMMKLCKPVKRGGELYWIDDPALLQQLYAYCMRDIEAEAPLDDILPPLHPGELAIWHMSERINGRGLKLDMANVVKCGELAEFEGRLLAQAVLKLTKGAATATQREKLLQWFIANGMPLEDLRKNTVRDAVKPFATLSDEDLTEAQRVLRLRQEASKSSTAKLKKMQARVCADNRARGEYRMYGAEQRWSSTGIQLHNLIRPTKGFKVADAENVYGWLPYSCARNAIRREYGSVMHALANSIRPLIVADKGKRLICADYSNIEGRMMAYLAGEQWKIDAFRAYDTITGYDAAGEPIRLGPDLYKLSFSRSFDVPVDEIDDDQRQAGKTNELACQYQAGHGGYLAMAESYDMDLRRLSQLVQAKADARDWQRYWEMYDKPGTDKFELPQAEWTAVKYSIMSWRDANSCIRQYWRDLEEAAIAAVAEPGKVTSAGVGAKVYYGVIDGFLWCKLPSGRKIAYGRPELRETTTPWGEIKQSVRVYGTDKGMYRPYHLYGGMQSNHVVQGASRDILAGAMLRLEHAGYPVVMHTHDEAAAERALGEGSLTEYVGIMCTLPAWAKGLPISVAGWEGERYRK